MVDPIGPGFGGLIAGAWNPNLLPSVAQRITPNPNPLAQQGPGGAGPGTVDILGNPSRQPPPGANLAPAAATQPDPTNAANVAKLTQPDSSFALTMLRYQNLGREAESFNQGMDRMAASFGTAQQQASKQAALRGGGGIGDGLGDLAKIQSMQQTQMDQSDAARFKANAAVFAQTLRDHGINVSDAQAAEIQSNPDLLSKVNAAAGANLQQTEQQKNAAAELAQWRQAHPNATDAEAAQHMSDFLAQTAGGLSTVGKQLAEDRRNWHNDPANAGKSDAEMIAERPDLANETAYVTIKGEEAKQKVQAGQDKLTAQQTFVKVDQSYKQMEDTVDWLNDPAHKAAVIAAANRPAGITQGVVGAGLAKLQSLGLPMPTDADINEARAKIDYLKKQQYADNFTGSKNVRSNTEANNLGASASNIDNINNKPEDVMQQLQSLQQRVYRERANTYASAGKAIPTKYEGMADEAYTTPGGLLYQGGHETLPNAPQSDIDEAQAYIAQHPDQKQAVIEHFHQKGFNGIALR